VFFQKRSHLQLFGIFIGISIFRVRYMPVSMRIVQAEVAASAISGMICRALWKLMGRMIPAGFDRIGRG
jgi:hypothetical protein